MGLLGKGKLLTMREITHITHEDWMKEGLAKFGADPSQWRFVCPSCGHVQSVQECRDAGMQEETVAFSCIGRWLDNPADILEDEGPCNYAGGGLFKLNPVKVVFPDGGERACFEWAAEESGP